jgi:hypothetical protein
MKPDSMKKSIIEELFESYENARSAMISGIVNHLTKVVDNNHALKVEDSYDAFHNCNTKEDENIKYITTDGESIFLMSGEEECFFDMLNYGSVDWDCFIDLLTSDCEVVEIDWVNMI